MIKADYLDILTNNAKKYRKDANDSINRNSHMNRSTGDEINQHDIDALLVDFINFVGMQMGVDYAVYTHDIVDEIIVTG